MKSILLFFRNYLLKIPSFYRLYQYMGEIWRDVLKNTDPGTAARKDQILSPRPLKNIEMTAFLDRHFSFLGILFAKPRHY